jgi:hypothetical protein
MTIEQILTPYVENTDMQTWQNNVILELVSALESLEARVTATEAAIVVLQGLEVKRQKVARADVKSGKAAAAANA